MFLLYIATVSVIFDAVISTVREQAQLMEFKQAERLNRLLGEDSDSTAGEVKIMRASHALVITKAFRCASESIKFRMETLPTASIYSHNSLKERIRLAKEHKCNEFEDQRVYSDLEKQILSRKRSLARSDHSKQQRFKPENFWPYQKAINNLNQLRAPANGEIHEANHNSDQLIDRFKFTEFSDIPHRAPSTVAIQSLRCSFFFLRFTLFGGDDDDEAAVVDDIHQSCGAVQDDISNRMSALRT